MECAELIKIINDRYEIDLSVGTLSRKNNTKTGNINSRGYVVISINKKPYYLHRLIWLLKYGEFPKNGIDHIDRNQKNNSISNLRECNQQENCHNKEKNKNNKSGYKGVYFETRSRKFIASCIVNKKRHWIGSYKEKEDASLAYENFAKENCKDFYYNNLVR